MISRDCWEWIFERAWEIKDLRARARAISLCIAMAERYEDYCAVDDFQFLHDMTIQEIRGG